MPDIGRPTKPVADPPFDGGSACADTSNERVGRMLRPSAHSMQASLSPSPLFTEAGLPPDVSGSGSDVSPAYRRVSYLRGGRQGINILVVRHFATFAAFVVVLLLLMMMVSIRRKIRAKKSRPVTQKRRHGDHSGRGRERDRITPSYATG
jgi:hypothetical protein